MVPYSTLYLIHCAPIVCLWHSFFKTYCGHLNFRNQIPYSFPGPTSRASCGGSAPGGGDLARSFTDSNAVTALGSKPCQGLVYQYAKPK